MTRESSESDNYTEVNEWGDQNTLMFSLSSDDNDTFEVVQAGVQGFVRGKKHKEGTVENVPGVITKHEEAPGVYEIYWPLLGEVKVTRDGEKHTLKGKLEKLGHRDLKKISRGGVVSISQGMDNATLTLTSADGKEIQIDGFIVPPETEHSATKVPTDETITRYVAIKVKKKDNPL